MIKKLVFFTVLVTLLSMGGSSWATIITDDFSTPHNYLTSGVSGTIWDGMVKSASVSQMAADANGLDRLYFASNNAWGRT